jgi:hypothetical protein
VTIPKSTYPIDVDPEQERIDFGYDVNFTGNVTHNGEAIGGMITIDADISPTSTNPLENRGVYDAIEAKNGKGIPYGYCTTGASTKAKIVTVSPDISELTSGLMIAVKFQYANTASSTATSPVTLNVNGLGAKEIMRYGTTRISSSAATSWNANSVVVLAYDGTHWLLSDYNNTTYSGMTAAEYQAGTSTSARLISPANLKAAIQWWAPEEKIFFDTKANWDAQPTLVGELNTIYIYTDYQTKTIDGVTYNIAGVKIGDGNAYLIDNPFLDSIYYDHVNDTSIHVTSSEKSSWNNKVTCYVVSQDPENLIFTKNDVF